MISEYRYFEFIIDDAVIWAHRGYAEVLKLTFREEKLDKAKTMRNFTVLTWIFSEVYKKNIQVKLTL